jgi:hypothetical protein
MRAKQVAMAAMAAVFGLVSALLATEASARSRGGGGHSAGGHGGASYSGGARATFNAGVARSNFSNHNTNGVRYAAGARPSVAFVGVSPPRHAGLVSVGHGPRHVRRGHHFIGGYTGYYGYGTFSSGRGYSACSWLKARYEDTGQHKWRARYYECLNGYDD